MLGAGLGGLFDGIVFHQILQWHHMISSVTPPQTVPGLELNTLFDGLFHGAAWVITLIGMWLVQRADPGDAGRVAGRVMSGGVVAGWGAFNLIEGVVDHYVLGVHHVRPGPSEALYDLAFLVWGATFVVAGWLAGRSAGTASVSSRKRSPRAE